MSILAAQGQERFIKAIGDYTEEQSTNKLEYITGQNSNGQKRALDAVIYGLTSISSGNTVGAGSSKRVIKRAAHGARKNDVIQFSSGTSDGVSIQILSCPDADTMILAATSEFSIGVGDTFDIKRYVTPEYSSSGSLSVNATPGPSQFILNGSDVEVEQDDAVPANNKPFPSGMFIDIDGIAYPVGKNTGSPAQTVSIPVELTGAAGPINITAGDLNVQLSDQGANADVTRIGDGTNQLGINASKEALVLDTDLNLAIGEKADSVATTDVGTFSLISLTKKVAKNISDLSTSSSIPLVASYDEILALTTVQTFTAPAKAVSATIMAISDNTVNVRFKQGGVATATSGLRLEPGRSETLMNSSDVSVCSESAACEVNIIWNIKP